MEQMLILIPKPSYTPTASVVWISGGFRWGKGRQPSLSKQGAVAPTAYIYGRARSLCDRLSTAVQSASPFKNPGSATGLDSTSDTQDGVESTGMEVQ